MAEASVAAKAEAKAIPWDLEKGAGWALLKALGMEVSWAVARAQEKDDTSEVSMGQV